MQVSGGFQVFRSEEKNEGVGGCQGDENPGVSPQEEVGRGILSRHEDNGGLRLQDIVTAMEWETRISFNQVKSGKRAMGKLLKLRFMFTALCRKYLVYSFPQIARLLGKDHTTTVYYDKKHRESSMDPEYLEQYNQIEANVEEILKQKRKQEDNNEL